jgi:hypothetical protein
MMIALVVLGKDLPNFHLASLESTMRASQGLFVLPLPPVKKKFTNEADFLLGC